MKRHQFYFVLTILLAIWHTVESFRPPVSYFLDEPTSIWQNQGVMSFLLFPVLIIALLELLRFNIKIERKRIINIILFIGTLVPINFVLLTSLRIISYPRRYFSYDQPQLNPAAIINVTLTILAVIFGLTQIIRVIELIRAYRK